MKIFSPNFHLQNENESSPISDWNFSLTTVVSSTISGSGAFAGVGVSDTIGAIEFDPSDHLIATAGIARKIRIYPFNSLLPNENRITFLDHITACDYYICTPAKLSSLRWKPNFNSRVIGSGDYDGVVTEYDLEKKVPIFERDEHGGRRVWSMDYSNSDPGLTASGSDDGSMQMWDSRCSGEESVAKVIPSVARSSVCCVEFNPFDGALIAVGCADRKIYGYDIRRVTNPVSIFDGHCKTVTYVKFLDSKSMVSASVDGSLKLWNVDDPEEIRTFTGHANSRSFVGLSVWGNGGLLGCGSENNRVFVYDKRWSSPIWVHGFETGGFEDGWVSSVCWKQMGDNECSLVAGGSDGALRVFLGKINPLDFNKNL